MIFLGDAGLLPLYMLILVLILQNIETHSSDASHLIPQHNYKLDANALSTRHPGEVCF